MGKISECTKHHDGIMDLIARGKPATEIASHFSIGPYNLQSYLRRRGIKTKHGKRAAKKIDDQNLTVLLAQGLTHPQIASILGVCRSCVERRAVYLGLQTARTGPRSTNGHPQWGGGRTLAKYGYIDIYVPLHPLARKIGRVPEHRLVMEIILERYLLEIEVVNHKDDHPCHNWPDNLNLFANNADHLRHELTGRKKATPRSSTVGAYGCNQKMNRCPDTHETLEKCSSETIRKLSYYIDSHRPTNEHKTLARREFLRAGAWRDPFQSESMEKCSDSLP